MAPPNAAAGTRLDPAHLADIPALITAYYSRKPQVDSPAERVAFGTSGHRGSSLLSSFNEDHILAITQAICEYRQAQGISGPLFLGADTHALSTPGVATALEVLAANGVQVMIAKNAEPTPTPAVSHAILVYNWGRKDQLADGILVTPSHNPPEDGGFKYNPPNGGPAAGEVTAKIEARANALLASQLKDLKRWPYERARQAPTTHEHDFLGTYVDDLAAVIDMSAIKNAGLKLGVDPLGGAGVHYWSRIAERYGLDLTVVNSLIDPTFRFVPRDWDGRIRMDPSSPYAMRELIALKDRFTIAFACDTDHDRHGIVARSVGLMPPNHYLSVAIDYLFSHRPQWGKQAAIGKTAVSSQMIDRVAGRLGRRLVETPVGFKWFVAGLLSGELGFGGEESAGASFLRRDGTVWTTDKDGIVPALLAAEITAVTGKDPGELYQGLTRAFGEPVYDRVEAKATPSQKAVLAKLSSQQVTATELAGDKIELTTSRAAGNDAPLGGLKVATKNGWFAARPSGTEDIYKIYAESFSGPEHLKRLLAEAQTLVDNALKAAP